MPHFFRKGIVMKLRMKFLSWPSLWLWFVGALLFVSTLKADPPTAPPLPVDLGSAQIQIEAVIYEVDPLKLQKLAGKTRKPVAELLKLNGFKLVKEEDRKSVV